MLRTLLAPLVGLACLTMPALARDHFVAARDSAPVAAPDGSAQAPWPTIRVALDKGDPDDGDRILLADGHHGALWLSKYRFKTPIVITAANPGKAHLSRISVVASQGLTFTDLNVWPLSPPDQVRQLVLTDPKSRNIRFERLDVRGRADAPDSYLDWTPEDWVGRWRSSGARLQGSQNSLIDSRLTGLGFAISMEGPNGLAQGNHVEGFSGDGVRVLGDNSVILNNRIENCVKVDGNHDDGIQSWAPKKQSPKSRTVSGLRLDSNTILEWTGPKNHPLRCTLQGIGMFDGIYQDVTIINNLVAVTAYHGITLYGGRNSEIINNTVVHAEGGAENFPWIQLKDHKNGAPASGNLVANNVAMKFADSSSDRFAMKNHANILTRYPVRAYRDLLGGDFRPTADSGLLGAADPSLAPSVDILGTPRPQGNGPDVGAFELP